MPRAYFRTLPDLYERKAFGTDDHPPYPPVAIACFLGVLCLGEQQSERGRFKSRRLLTVLLEGPRGAGRTIARQLGFLIDQGDLIELPDGSLYIEGWDELQEGNWQVAERMSRYRARTHGVTVPVTVDVTVPVTPDPSRVEAVGGKRLADSGLAAASSPDDHDALDVYHELTGYRPWGQWSGDSIRSAMNDYTDAVVVTAFRSEYAVSGDRKDLLNRTLARLAREADHAKAEAKDRPRPKLVKADDAERARVAHELRNGETA